MVKEAEIGGLGKNICCICQRAMRATVVTYKEREVCWECLTEAVERMYRYGVRLKSL